jgi:hypothetical protein
MNNNYIDSYKELYSKLGGSFQQHLSNDTLTRCYGWIDDNYNTGYYYKSLAVGRIAYDYGVVEQVIYLQGIKEFNPENPKHQNWLQHIELMKDFYNLKSETLHEIQKEMKGMYKEAYKKIPRINNTIKN